VVHAHPRSALLCGLAGLNVRPVFGAYNIPAMRLALRGVPIFPKTALVTRPELAREVVAAMAESDACLLLGHGVVVGGETVEQATVRTVDLDVLLDVTVRLKELGAEPEKLSAEDLAELPDLGSAFNDQLAWRALVAELTPK
jgi:ribulose-5-phosphate 4-epimerase/fuculose-1-phosphate aldolase